MAARGCTRFNPPPTRWALTGRELYQVPTLMPISAGLYRGRLGGPHLRGVSYLGLRSFPEDYPHEPPEDGCPGGWYRTRFASSVAPYRRRRTEGGGRVPNPMFDAAPWQVQAAVMHLEHEQERHAAYRHEVNDQRRKDARKG